MKNLIIGIAGGSGSGKTTLALRLKERFGEDEVRLISHDSYYKRHDELPFEERCKLNYDHPDAFDNALLIYHLQELKAGRAIDCPVYDYADHNRSNKVQHIEPAPVLIVEGILPFVEPELCELFDYKIYVDTDADERILRRILRDVKERGRSLDSVIQTAAGNAQTVYALGDVNADAAVTLDDAFLTLQQYAYSAAGGKHILQPAQRRAADADNDGKLSMDDAFLWLQYYSMCAAGQDVDLEAFLVKNGRN